MNELNNVLVAKDVNGDKVVVIPQVIFKGKRTIPWDEVEQYLLRYVGKIFEVAGRLSRNVKPACNVGGL